MHFFSNLLVIQSICGKWVVKIGLETEDQIKSHICIQWGEKITVNNKKKRFHIFSLDCDFFFFCLQPTNCSMKLKKWLGEDPGLLLSLFFPLSKPQFLGASDLNPHTHPDQKWEIKNDYQYLRSIFFHLIWTNASRWLWFLVHLCIFYGCL